MTQRALHGHGGLARHGQLFLRGTLFLSLKELGRDHLAIVAEIVRVLSAMHCALGVRGHDVRHVLGLELGEISRVGRVDEGELAVQHRRVPRGEPQRMFVLSQLERAVAVHQRVERLACLRLADVLLQQLDEISLVVADSLLVPDTGEVVLHVAEIGPLLGLGVEALNAAFDHVVAHLLEVCGQLLLQRSAGRLHGLHALQRTAALFGRGVLQDVLQLVQALADLLRTALHEGEFAGFLTPRLAMEHVRQLGEGVDVGVAQPVRGAGEHGVCQISDRPGHFPGLVAEGVGLQVLQHSPNEAGLRELAGVQRSQELLDLLVLRQYAKHLAEEPRGAREDVVARGAER